MECGIFAKTFEGAEAASLLAAARRAGYATVQFNMACLGLPAMPDDIPRGAAEGVAKASRETGVSIAALSGTYNMIHPDPAERALGLRRLNVLAASCHAMGTSLLTLCTGTRDPEDQWRAHPGNAAPDAWRDLLVEMERALAIAERYDIALGIEPELANVVDSAARARLLLDELASPRLRIVLDPANLFEIARDNERRRLVEEAVDLLGADIAMAHAKDRAQDGSFTTAGKGVIDFGHFVQRLHGAGFDGPLITHGLAAAEAPATAAFLADVLAEAGLS